MTKTTYVQQNFDFVITHTTWVPSGVQSLIHPYLQVLKDCSPKTPSETDRQTKSDHMSQPYIYAHVSYI